MPDDDLQGELAAINDPTTAPEVPSPAEGTPPSELRPGLLAPTDPEPDEAP